MPGIINPTCNPTFLSTPPLTSPVRPNIDRFSLVASAGCRLGFWQRFPKRPLSGEVDIDTCGNIWSEWGANIYPVDYLANDVSPLSQEAVGDSFTIPPLVHFFPLKSTPTMKKKQQEKIFCHLMKTNVIPAQAASFQVWHFLIGDRLTPLLCWSKNSHELEERLIKYWP